MVVAIVVVGGITRLTESGLSITEWKPVTGAIPPLSEAQWQAEFAAYQRIPQYVEVNGPAGMTLADYKFIYFWEWAHRLLARLIGLAFALPLAWFWVKRQIPAGYKPRLLVLLALGGLQGAVGWWMVASGLTAGCQGQPLAPRDASAGRLLTLGGLVWTALDLRAHARGEPTAAAAAVSRAGAGGAGDPAALWRADRRPAGRLCRQRLAADAGQPVPGGDRLVAGRGPCADRRSVSGPFHPSLVGLGGRGLLIVMARRLRQPGTRPASIAIHSAFGSQLMLGIATVMTGVALWIAVLHQLTGALLLAATVWGAHLLGGGNEPGWGNGGSCPDLVSLPGSGQRGKSGEVVA